MENIFPLHIVQRSAALMILLRVLGIVGPVSIVAGIAWGFMDKTASTRVTFLVALGGCVVLLYGVLTLISFFMIKRGTFSIHNNAVVLDVGGNKEEYAYQDVQRIILRRRSRRLVQPKYWYYKGWTYLISVQTKQGKTMIEWDSMWNAQDINSAVTGEKVHSALIEAGLGKEKVILKEGSWMFLLWFAFLGGLIWFVFFF